ncbi:MAG: hypothetical protein U0835_17740 [Isosphaeraceae bacterium]
MEPDRSSDEATDRPVSDKAEAGKSPGAKKGGNAVPKKPPSAPRTRTAAGPPAWYWLAAFVVFLLIAVSIAVVLPRQTPAQQYYFRILMGLAAAGIAAIIPGFFDIELKWLRNTIRAGGAIGAFVFLFLINPPKFDPDDMADIDLGGDWEFFLVIDNKDIKGGNARIRHVRGSRVFSITGNVPANPAAPPGALKSPLVTFESNFGVITAQRVVFHYRNNANEEGVASADYATVSPDELLFNFNDYADTDKDGVSRGLLRFKRLEQ